MNSINKGFYFKKYTMNDYEYLIKQLNLIVGFIDVSDRKIYEQIKSHDRFNLGITIEQMYEYNYENYSNHITSSALLLGFAHFEDFLAKCIIKLLVRYPQKNEYKVAFKTIKEKNDELIEHIAEQQSRQLTFTEKIKFLKKNLGIAEETLVDEIKFVNDLRNCLMHNNGYADKRLSREYIEGQKIILTSGVINSYGLDVRRLADMIWQKME